MTTSKTLAAASLILALSLATPSLAAKNDVTLTTPFGDSSALDFTWGAANSSSAQGGGGAGAGKATIQNVSVSRNPDSQSAKFVESVVRGTVLTSVTLSKGPLRLVLSGVTIASYAIEGPDGEKSTENISMSFRKFSYTADGTAPFCFDVATNAPC